MDKKVRVRFAPSPTGPLHIGGVRTALYNYLFAKKYNGTFILRVEDTDRNRFVEGAEAYITEALKWCNIQEDEGVNAGGNFSPYRQSERSELYAEYAERLVKSDAAYYAFDTPEEISAMRERQKEGDSASQQYDIHTRMDMRNSLTMSEAEVKKEIDAGTPYVVRFKMPENEDIEMKDRIRGEITVRSATLDDKILFKSDGMPTYHLANVVDDYLMGISHVIRGEEWLPSLPLHILLYKAFNWEDQIPEFAHLPLLLKPDGKGKLSKRDGDKMGFPVFPLQWKDPKTGEISSGYRESGYFPDAFINMLVLLGWNPGTEQEIFTMEELIQAFSLDRVGKSGARFDPDKAVWFNNQYLQQKPDAALAESFCNILDEKSMQYDREMVDKIIPLIKERVNFVHEMWSEASFFFEAPREFPPKALKKKWKGDTADLIRGAAGVLEKTAPFSAANIESQVKMYIENLGTGFGQVIAPLRILLTGDLKGPELFVIMEILGKEEVLSRIQNGIMLIEG